MGLSDDERAHAESLLVTSERRLRIRDKQINRYGDNVSPEIVLDAEDLRRQILALKAILEPELSDEVSGLVKRRLEDDYFIFQQTLGAKQDVAILRDEVVTIKHNQALATEGRMRSEDKIDRVVAIVHASEHARKTGAPLLRRALLLAIAVALVALIVGCIALGLAIRW